MASKCSANRACISYVNCLPDDDHKPDIMTPEKDINKNIKIKRQKVVLKEK